MFDQYSRHACSEACVAERFRQSRTQGEAGEWNVQWTFHPPNADIARAVSMGRRGL
ncbi:hypothetical protein ACEYYA_13065 [Paracoccus sp. p3-h83]|uniref:hypothetical protein n=1 Tax=Paracoccus sp. p3-h83 TaxID=3342805 RepID=UPI0035B98154